MVVKFVKNEFLDVDDPTVEDRYKTELVVDGLNVKLNILDTSGNDTYATSHSRVK